MFGADPSATAGGIVFTGILLAAAIGDVRVRRIPNKLIVVLAVLGLMFSVWQEPIVPGLIRGGGGLGVGLVCWLPFYMLGWLGAGDVKLYAAAGAWLGMGRAFEGAMVGALAGAVLSLIWMMKTKGVKNAVHTLGLAAGTPELLAPGNTEPSRRSSMPYGIAIAIGALWAGWMPRMMIV